jgi:hypothetical protein
MPHITRSISLHRLYPDYLSTRVSKVFQAWNKCIPYVRPWYAVSPASSPDMISLMRNQRIPMVCNNAREVKLVNHDRLVVVDGKNIGYHECIVRKMNSKESLSLKSSVPLWIHTTISNEGVEQTRKMFEYVWANKHILNGIVFDISNFTHPTQSIPPSMYSYKIAMDYVFRNIVYPFHNEYGIVTPSIMIDGRNHITRVQHLYDLHEQGLSRCNHLWEKYPQIQRPNLHLIVGSLLDNGEL